VQQTAHATQDVTATIGGVSQAAGATGTAAERLLDVASELSSSATLLSTEVAGFLGNVRAA
jgi:methyl-accepting chemotaxis protein